MSKPAKIICPVCSYDWEVPREAEYSEHQCDHRGYTIPERWEPPPAWEPDGSD